MITPPKDAFGSRINGANKHAAHFKGIIDDAYKVGDYLDAADRRFGEDKHLSSAGRKDRMAKLVKDKAVREIADAGRHVHVAKAANEALRAKIGKPTFDSTDMVAAMERREVRDYLRGLSDVQRLRAAFEMIKDRKLAEAILSGPSMSLTGLNAEQFAQLQDAYLRTHFTDEIRRVNAMDDDLQAIEGAVLVNRRRVQEASGMQPHEFENMMAPIERRAIEGA